MDEFLQQVRNTAKAPQKAQVNGWAKLFDLDPTQNKFIVKLNAQNVPQDVRPLVEKLDLYDGDWLAFDEVVASYIRLCSQMNPWSMLESFDLYTDFLDSLSVAFANNKGWILVTTIRRTINVILPMANSLDVQLYYKENCRKPRLSYLASVLLKIFNQIRSQVSTASETGQTKSTILLFIGTNLCKVYFKISNPLLCQNVFSNLNNLSTLKFGKKELVPYRFYLAKFYLIKNQLVDSFQHFQWCLLNCPILKDHNSIAMILKYLIPTGMLVGKLPNFAFMRGTYFSGQGPQYFEVYEMLFKYLQLGDYTGYNRTLQHHQRFLRSVNLFVALESKGVVLLIRNLFKKIWIGLHKPLKIDYNYLKTGLVLSGLDFIHTSDDTVVENVLVTLIDQNLIRGKIFPRLRAVSLSKTNVFPEVDAINFIKFGNGSGGTLNANDQWMEAVS